MRKWSRPDFGSLSGTVQPNNLYPLDFSAHKNRQCLFAAETKSARYGARVWAGEDSRAGWFVDARSAAGDVLGEWALPMRVWRGCRQQTWERDVAREQGEGGRRGEGRCREEGRKSKGGQRREVVAIQGAMPKPHERLRCRSRCIRRRTHVVGNGGGRRPADQSSAASHLPESGLRHPPPCYLAHLPQRLRHIGIMDGNIRGRRGRHLATGSRRFTRPRDCLSAAPVYFCAFMYLYPHVPQTPHSSRLYARLGGVRIVALASRGPCTVIL